MTMYSWASTFCAVCTVVATIGYVTPYFLVACLPLGAVYYWTQKFYIPTARGELKIRFSTTPPYLAIPPPHHLTLPTIPQSHNPTISHNLTIPHHPTVPFLKSSSGSTQCFEARSLAVLVRASKEPALSARSVPRACLSMRTWPPLNATCDPTTSTVRRSVNSYPITQGNPFYFILFIYEAIAPQH